MVSLFFPDVYLLGNFISLPGTQRFLQVSLPTCLLFLFLVCTTASRTGPLLLPATHSFNSFFSNYKCQRSFPSTPISPAQACSLATACISFLCLLSTVFPMMPMPQGHPPATCRPPACWPSYHPSFLQISLNSHFFKKAFNVTFLVRHCFFLYLLSIQTHKKKKVKERNHK